MMHRRILRIGPALPSVSTLINDHVDVKILSYTHNWSDCICLHSPHYAFAIRSVSTYYNAI